MTSSRMSPRADTDAPVRSGRPERVDPFVVGVDEHRHRLRSATVGRGEEHEVVVEIARVLDDADHGPVDAIEVDRRADLVPTQVGDAVASRRPRSRSTG